MVYAGADDGDDDAIYSNDAVTSALILGSWLIKCVVGCRK